MEDSKPNGNRRGQRSRQEILDAAAKVMATRGYAGTSLSALVQESGIPKSAIYHHFESKAGLLSEVMARGAREFFAAMRDAHQTPPEDGTPHERLGWYLHKTGEVFVHREDFLRLLLLLVMSSEATDAPEAMQTIADIRKEGLDYMRHMIRMSFSSKGEAIADELANALAFFGVAGFDGAFVGMQSGDGRTMSEYMTQLTNAMAALGTAHESARGLRAANKTLSMNASR
ncbi:MAG: TetR/AcrR family transcriptional regulator [Comamonas sp.]|jgi:AcrR family transcriptional regulator|uniref:TetR/AcrR family transcriptional regulator n=1 Tax=Comamonas sp. TaxID=34028 RepID=UPI002825F959|nr:TetR/AcrR family transcriptional regulator [Comamonas sp.]MDR0216709.1 TetR/AcrR family transcriptional regulator [Comamonas sp.]